MATTGTIDTAAMDRAARRLQAWAGPRPEAALLARYAALAVRVDAPLLRRLRLQLLPRAEPGIEADVWFSGLHESQGRNGFVFDARVQQLLRGQLAAAVPAGQRWPLQQAWDITAGLHADWPQALRTEEALTFQALRGTPDSAAQIEALLAPALKAMAGGGEARALEVARWAQRAVPRLPDAARQHPAALALWLGALLRLGLPADQLPDTGAAGLPAQLRWLLPAAQLSARQGVALTPFDDALQLEPLADAAPAAAQQIQLPRTSPLLLALNVLGAAGKLLQQRTLALDASAAQTRLPLPPDWQTLELHSLSGERWRLQRQAGSTPVDTDPLPWQRMRVQVLGESGPSGLGCFVSSTEVVTVVDVLPQALVQALRAADGAGRQQQSAGFDEALLGPSGDPLTVRLHAWEADGDRQELQARLVALDLRSSLALLALQRPFAGALVAHRALVAPAVDTPAWLGAGLHAETGRWAGKVRWAGNVTWELGLPTGRAAPDSIARHFGLQLPQTLQDLAGIAGAPVFADRLLVGMADLAAVGESSDAGSTVWAVPAPAIDRFLAWARRPQREAPQLLLHHAADDPDGKGAELVEPAVQRIAHAAWRAHLRLVQAPGGSVSLSSEDATGSASFSPGLAAAVRLVTPVSRENSTPAARMQLQALAARRWAQPEFGVLHLAFQRLDDKERLPAPLAGAPLQVLMRTEPEALARQLLDLAEPAAGLALANGHLAQASQQQLEAQLATLARPFQPSPEALQRVLDAARARDLRAVADQVMPRWKRSSRLDAVPLVELLAQLALPVQDDGLLDRLRAVPRGALALNAMPLALARLLIARANAGRAPPPCLVVRDQAWEGTRSVVRIENQLAASLSDALGCSTNDGRVLLRRLDLAPWVLVTTRPLPDKPTLDALASRLPSARFLFLAGQQPGLPAAAAAVGMEVLPALPAGADMHWLTGYKRLMDWAKPRKRPARPAAAARGK